MTREDTVRNLLTELIDMIDNGSQRDLDRADEISKSILKVIEKEPCCNCIEFKRYAKVMGFEIEQEPRKGHWTEEFNDLEGEVRFTCSSCGKYQLFGSDFCYHCGSDNREVIEE